ncbi:MAG: ATP-binding cassette domain-containing protein, partial [Candidatus Nanopelagicales bacterium]
MTGANGSGKSSMLTALAGLLPWQGRVTLAGEPLRPGAASERVG